MARRTYIIVLCLFGVAFADILSIRGLDDQPESTEDQDWSYFVTANPKAVQNLYTDVYTNESRIESLIKDNPTMNILMEKAKRRSAKLEMRLLQLADYINSLAMVERLLEQYVNNSDKLEPDSMMNYAEWCVSLDSGAPKGVLEKIHNLVVPMFKNQGLLELLYTFSKWSWPQADFGS